MPLASAKNNGAEGSGLAGSALIAVTALDIPVNICVRYF